MELKLLKLELQNFKGIKKFCLKTGGENIIVQGKNGIGKTTLADAWFWLLTGSNLDGQAKYNIIELDDGSVPLNHQNAEVQAQIQVGSKNVMLQKTYRQIWRKKRGQAEAEFSGHTTDHRWDGIDVSAKEYQRRLDELCPAAIIRSLTDVHHFCGRLRPDDRRHELISLAGEINMLSICEQYDDLHDLPDLIGDYTIADFEKRLKSQRKESQKSLKEIPIEINSKREEIADIDGLDETEIRGNIAALDEQISGIKNELVALGNGSRIMELKRQRAEIEGGLIDLANRALKKIAGIEKERDAYFAQIASCESDADLFRREISRIDAEIATNRSDDQKLVAAWREISAGGKKCLTCGQKLPPESVESQLNEIVDKGKRLAEELAGLNAMRLEKLEKIKLSEQAAAEARLKVDTLADVAKNATSNDVDIIALKKLKAEVESAIENKGLDIEPEKKRLEQDLGSFTRELEAEQGKLSSIRSAERTRERIADKEAMLKAAAIEYEECERQLYMLELYGRKRSEYIEETVSQKFEITAWKLFEEQINAGSREICEAVYQGVPYSTDLNTGARIQVGLDVIKTLSKHHGVKMPIFIDNAESVTNWMIDLDNQLIRLVAAANIDKLEVVNAD
jgi:DNA repair exonuclease SbcCD ATPase subunit